MIWWLIRILFFAAFIVLEIRLSQSTNKWLGLIPPACFSFAALGIYIMLKKEVEFFGVAADNAIAFSGMALLMIAVYFICRFKKKPPERETKLQ